MEAKEHEKAKGRGFDAEASLVVDFGPFRPLDSDLWTAEQFVVEQLGYTPSDEKEATWSSFGMDSGSLGWRVDFIVWDDLVDKTTMAATSSRSSASANGGRTRPKPASNPTGS